MIYGRFGTELKDCRIATAKDVTRLEGRTPGEFDDWDKTSLENGSYIVAKDADDDEENLHHLSYMRADGGLTEIMNAIQQTA